MSAVIATQRIFGVIARQAPSLSPAPDDAGLAVGCRRMHFPSMVFAELKPQIEQLDPDERLKALAFLKHLVRANSPEYQAELARRNAEMDAGQKIRWSDLKRDHGLS